MGFTIKCKRSVLELFGLTVMLFPGPTLSAAQQTTVPMSRSEEEIKIPEGDVSLGTIRLPVTVTADGQPLTVGTYRLRLTGEVAKPAVIGQAEKLERWVEFRQGSTVKARAVASIVPGAAIKEVAEGVPPAAGRPRVERLKEDDYLRIWINHRGDHVLLHLPIAKNF